MRGSVSEEMRCLARGVGRFDGRLGPQHLEDHDRLVDVGGQGGASGDLVLVEARPDVRRGAREDQLTAPRAQLGDRARQRAQGRVADRVGVAEVDDQPAHAAGQRGVDAALELGCVGVRDGALEVHLMHDVVEALLADRKVTRTDHGAQ